MIWRQLFAKKPIEAIMREMEEGHRLRRSLGPIQLAMMGIGAIIGTGIFVLIGVASRIAGPSLMLSFVVAGLACLFAALCYAEFASMAPVAGSAYTYSYVTVGEFFAWIVGWDLILEYTVASSAVSVGWSGYFNKFLKTFFGVELPEAIRTAPLEFSHGEFLLTGGFFNVPAAAIALIIMGVLVIGIRESALANAIMVAIKVGIVLFIIAVGFFYINPENWTPFAPYGYSGISLFGYKTGPVDDNGKPLGMLAGAAIIFFAYIGFDAVSTQAEEAKNPDHDVPFGIVASLLVCTLLYVAMAAVLTGMVS